MYWWCPCGGCGGSINFVRTALDEVPDDGIRRSVEFSEGTLKVDPSGAEQGDAIRDVVGADHVVSDNDRSDVKMGLQAPNQTVDGVGDNRIKARRRLIVEDAGGLGNDDPCQRGPLAHPPTEVCRHLGFLSRKGDQFQGFPDLAPDLLLIAKTPLTEGEGNILKDSHGIEERSILEKHPDFPADRLEFPLVEARDLFPFHSDGAGNRLEKTDQMPQEDAFSPATLSQKDQGFSPRNIQVDAPQDFLTAECLAEPPNLDQVAFGRVH